MEAIISLLSSLSSTIAVVVTSDKETVEWFDDIMFLVYNVINCCFLIDSNTKDIITFEFSHNHLLIYQSVSFLSNSHWCQCIAFYLIILSTYAFPKKLNTYNFTGSFVNFCKFNSYLIKLQDTNNKKRLDVSWATLAFRRLAFYFESFC